MSVPLLFALIGTVILVGFLANLLFRLTKIPSVLVLIAIGVVLGPVTGWIRHDALLTIAPYFGAVALLVILFEGGLELDVAHVMRHAPRTALFTTVVFVLSMAAGVVSTWLPAAHELRLGRTGLSDNAIATLETLPGHGMLPADLPVVVTLAPKVPSEMADTVAQQIQQTLGLSRKPTVASAPSRNARAAMLGFGPVKH